jgi:uncharacterized protein YllA (UPF0747 family)
MTGLEMLVNVNQDRATIDVAFIERLIHEALSDAGVPIIDVEFEGMRDTAAPITATDLVGPGRVTPTLPPGARRIR